MSATFALLTLALAALWWPADAAGRRRFERDHLWLALLAAAVVAALAARILEPLGVGWIVVFATAVKIFAQAPAASWPRRVATVGVVVIAAGLMAHQLPGFNNPLVIASALFSEGATGYRLHLNFDKPMVGLFLLAWLHARVRRAAEWRGIGRRATPVAVGLITLIMVLALVTGYVRFEPKLPREGWLWAWANLFLTCIAEEAFFRGFVQAQLQHRWQRVRGGAGLALGVAAVLFGLAHAAGGFAYVALSTVAGAGYGWAYRRSGDRIEASILTHFALNATHFLLFTYPALTRT